MNKPPIFRSVPCPHCSSQVRINDPATQEGERWIRRDERRLLARMVRESMTAPEIRQLADCDRPLLARLAQSLLQAIADRENEDAA